MSHFSSFSCNLVMRFWLSVCSYIDYKKFRCRRICQSFHFESQKDSITSICLSTSFQAMPFNWTVERERQMLLLAICEANLKPTMETWSIVARILGGDISPSAVRCGSFLPIVVEFSIQMSTLPSVSRQSCPHQRHILAVCSDFPNC